VDQLAVIQWSGNERARTGLSHFPSFFFKFPGDGFAVSEVMREFLDGKKKSNNLLTKKHKASLPIWNKLQTYFYGPYNIYKSGSEANARIWSPCTNRAWAYNIAASPTIPTDLIKSIKNVHNVSFVAVILAAFGKALSKYLTEAGHQPPETMNLNHPIALPDHPQKLTNYVYKFTNTHAIYLSISNYSPSSLSQF